MSMCRGFHFNLVEREANQSESVGWIKGRKRCSPRRGTKTRPEPENNHFAIAPGVIENGNFPSAATPHVETSQNLKWKTRSPARAECYANGSGHPPRSCCLFHLSGHRSRGGEETMLHRLTGLLCPLSGRRRCRTMTKERATINFASRLSPRIAHEVKIIRHYSKL